MRANQRAIASYGDVKVSTGVAKASNVELIQMLFDGLLEQHLNQFNITGLRNTGADLDITVTSNGQ